LHYGEEEDGWGIDQDVNSTRVMNNILSSEAPDFVVVSSLPLSHLHASPLLTNSRWRFNHWRKYISRELDRLCGCHCLDSRAAQHTMGQHLRKPRLAVQLVPRSTFHSGIQTRPFLYTTLPFRDPRGNKLLHSHLPLHFGCSRGHIVVL
jgi:hypothetical protein